MAGNPEQNAWVERVLGVSIPGSGDDADEPDPATLFNQRLAALMPQIKQALGKMIGQDVKLKVSEAGVFGRKQDFPRANALLDDVERLLGIAPTPSAQPLTAPQTETTPQPTRAVSPTVVFTQSRLIWDRTRKEIQVGLQNLEKTVLEECKDEPDFPEIASNSKILHTILDFLDERLIDKLDEALNAESADERRELQIEARNIIDEYLDYVASDELVRDIDDNGFVEVGIVSNVTARLKDLSGRLRTLTTA